MTVVESQSAMMMTQREPVRNAIALSAADWLSLAAAPTFAMMAVLTFVVGSGPANTLCSVAHGASPLSSMVAMYGVMSVFGLGPWLKLVCSRGSGALRS
jgi:hypothetical protein